MLLTHYAPDVEAFLVTGTCDAPTTSAAPVPSAPLATTVVIDFGGMLSSLRAGCLGYRDLSPTGNVVEARSAVFDALRWSEGIPRAACVLLADVAAVAPGHEHVDAVRDRMYRAASGKTVTVCVPGGGGDVVLLPAAP